MKKTIQKLMAALLAVAMLCAMAVPAFAYDTKENIQDHNSFSGFQIFKGDGGLLAYFKFFLCS